MNAQLSDVVLPGFNLFKKGKVRDVYDLGDSLLIVATDRISAFDYVLPSTIPDKGKVLTQLSKFWFEYTALVCSHHMISADVHEFPDELRKHADVLNQRSMLVRKAQVIPVECVVRGYLAGSGWNEYREKGTISGVKIPPGLGEADRLKKPIFTPSTKAEVGHDENISFKKMQRIVGAELAKQIREISFELYQKASLHAVSKGIIIADTKFEFGLRDGALLLVDEIFTPDSSRFWPLAGYAPGKSQPSLDKQFVRDYLLSTAWDRQSVPPTLPPDIVEQTSRRYRDIYSLLTGNPSL
ncbi:MAG: phosphoribosylaminoimidazolesuccinocarboxamide synthase [Candidatus Aminicenantes bacterium]|nr:phosphoribosylaminoimidazolesuccinocarboxamide synthase [Candidatus Aminicenantes bacterium]